MKKALIIATIEDFLNFETNNIKLLQNMGYQVHVAANSLDVIRSFNMENVEKHQIDFVRNPFTVKNIVAYKQLCKLVKEIGFNVIHCHTPVGGVIGRIVAHKYHVTTIYTAHGFHFYKGAPVLNWLLYYPIERFLARWTDILITINKEDYERAKKFVKGQVVRIPGVGVDTKKFADCKINKAEKRRELNVPEDSFLILSVGELNKNKNHQIIIKALSLLQNKQIHYVIVGTGQLKNELEILSRKLKLEKQVHLLGYRQDIAEICKAADIFAHPSFREGLGIAVLEGMASGLPVIVSNSGGIKDYTETGKTGYCLSAKDCNGFALAIKKMYDKPEFRKKCSEYNREQAKLYDLQNTNKIMLNVYSSYLEGR